MYIQKMPRRKHDKLLIYVRLLSPAAVHHPVFERLCVGVTERQMYRSYELRPAYILCTRHDR